MTTASRPMTRRMQIETAYYAEPISRTSRVVDYLEVFNAPENAAKMIYLGDENVSAAANSVCGWPLRSGESWSSSGPIDLATVWLVADTAATDVIWCAMEMVEIP